MPRPYPEEFPRHAIELARLGEKPVSRIAAELGIAQAALHRWIRQAEIDEGERAPDEGFEYRWMGADSGNTHGRHDGNLRLEPRR